MCCLWQEDKMELDKTPGRDADCEAAQADEYACSDCEHEVAQQFSAPISRGAAYEIAKKVSDLILEEHKK
jgi:hypothetical protein